MFADSASDFFVALGFAEFAFADLASDYSWRIVALAFAELTLPLALLGSLVETPLFVPYVQSHVCE